MLVVMVFVWLVAWLLLHDLLHGLLLVARLVAHSHSLLHGIDSGKLEAQAARCLHVVLSRLCAKSRILPFAGKIMQIYKYFY